MNEHDRLGAAGNGSAPNNPPSQAGGPDRRPRRLAPSEVLFLLSLPLALAAVIFSGTLSFKEGQRLEQAKSNGLELVKWAEAAAALHEKGEASEPHACSALPPVAQAAQAASAPAEAASNPPHDTQASRVASAEGSASAAAAEASAPPSTWGKCKQALAAKGGPLAEATNPFNPNEPVFGAKCERDKPMTRGQVVIEKGTPPPPGISGSVSYGAIEDTEPMVKGLMLKIVVCDKGSYPIKVSEVKL